MESLVYIILSPIAAILMLIVGLVAWRRRDQPGGWALVAFSAAELGWLTLDSLSLLAPSAGTAVLFAKATLFVSPLLGIAWVAFVLSYTERFSRAARIAVGAFTLWSAVYGMLGMLNESHQLVWEKMTVLPDGPFLHVTYTLGPLAWAQVAFSWALVAASLGAIFWAYAGADSRSRGLSQWIVVGAMVPLVLNIVFLLGVGPLAKDFTPIAMAVSSGAFALGLARYQFLDLQPTARSALVDSLPDGMMALDARNRVVDVNPAMLTLLGDVGDPIGAGLTEVAPRLAAAIAEGADVPFRVGTGKDQLLFELRVSPLVSRTKQMAGRLVLLHDVTVRRKERTALRKANSALHTANVELKSQNDELDAFGHTVAHDLKNSIQGVLGYSEILRDEGPELDLDTHRLLSDDLVRSANKMDCIVQELLLLAGVRKATVETSAVDMDDVVAEALQRVQTSRTVPVAEWSRPAIWPVAIGYAPWVEEIWVNYLTNAAKYGGPTVMLGAEPIASSHARFWVHDDGPGLSLEAQSRLFVPFSRVGQQAVEGHGLGLSIVRRIVERLGGSCGVESSAGMGTRFWFSLPLAPEASGAVVSVSNTAIADEQPR